MFATVDLYEAKNMVKVIDTIKQKNEGVLTLFDLSEEGFSNIGEGERYRIWINIFHYNFGWRGKHTNYFTSTRFAQSTFPITA